MMRVGGKLKSARFDIDDAANKKGNNYMDMNTDAGFVFRAWV